MSPRPQKSRPKIALIDDEPDFRLILSVWLKPLYDVMSFEGPEELLARGPRAAVPDLIISDIRMPGLNGYKFCETLRSQPGYAGVPVLFLTGMDSDESYLLGMEAGAAAYMTKPVERHRLLERVRELLAKRPAELHG